MHDQDRICTAKRQGGAGWGSLDHLSGCNHLGVMHQMLLDSELLPDIHHLKGNITAGKGDTVTVPIVVGVTRDVIPKRRVKIIQMK